MAKGDKRHVVMGDGIVNDLTTGGANAALSAEMGKKLNNDKVNKSGDTMTDNLKVEKSAYPTVVVSDTTQGRYASLQYIEENRTMIQNAKDDNNRTILLIKDESASAEHLLTVEVARDGAWKSYDVYHTGNKPSGEYVGTGDAAKRIIETGGIGRAVILNSIPFGVSILTREGAFCLVDGAWTYADHSVFNSTGTIILNTDGVLNSAGTTYYYQVL